jgi:hypothetical protein
MRNVTGFSQVKYDFSVHRYYVGQTAANYTSRGTVGLSGFTPDPAYYDYISLSLHDIWDDQGDVPYSTVDETSWNALHVAPRAGRREIGLNELLAVATAHNRPMTFPEWGIQMVDRNTGGLRKSAHGAFFLQKCFDWFSTHNVAYDCYFAAGSEAMHYPVTRQTATYTWNMTTYCAPAVYKSLWNSRP